MSLFNSESEGEEVTVKSESKEKYGPKQKTTGRSSDGDIVELIFEEFQSEWGASSHSSEETNVIDYSSSLSSDYWKVYESGNYTDFSIKVGNEETGKTFRTHSLVLCTRSAFFANSLNETSVTIEDVMPDVFEILLRFIYTGKMSYSSCKDVDWINLLKGAVKFELDELITTVEDLLITKNAELVKQNILSIHNFAQTTVKLTKLLNYCNETMASHPDIIFNATNILALPKKTLITLLQNDDLNMKEGDIWMAVIKWAIGQIPGYTNNPNTWSFDEVNTIKDLVADCIPHVRFVDIAYAELFEKFVLYIELLPRKLRNDVFAYHLHTGKKVKSSRKLRGCKNETIRIDTETKRSPPRPSWDWRNRRSATPTPTPTPIPTPKRD